MLVCPVRGCQLALTREQRQWMCPRGHAFDVARSGYVNLLQPQDKRSKSPGDTAEAIAGRRRMHDLGLTQPLLEAIAAMAAISKHDRVLDAGCGEGFYLGNLQRLSACETAYGVDISIPAIDAAARRYPAVCHPAVCQWIVANADRGLPFVDRAFTRVLSITARLNAAEFRRVLHPEGTLLLAIPGADDLRELRGGSAGRDRVERTVAAFSAEGFVLSEHRLATHTMPVDVETVAALRHAIYRPGGDSAVAASPRPVDTVTFALDLLRFQRG
jgi:23S rRNA (guanine745-N1)-methyltransferase